MGRPKKNQTVSSVYQPKKIYSLDAMEDIVAGDDSLWAAMLRRFSKLHRVYGFEKVEPPLLEDLRLYDDAGNELPFLISHPVPSARAIQRARSFQVSLNASTTVITLETGLAQPLDGVTLESPAANFIKAVSIAGSADGQNWQRLAQGLQGRGAQWRTAGIGGRHGHTLAPEHA